MPSRGCLSVTAALLLGLLLLGLPLGPTEAQKTGVCPELPKDLNCTEECASDSNCADNLKCCRSGCVALCVLPNEKLGSCPQLNSAIHPLGICEDQCKVDSQCPGVMKCCRNGCGNVSCATPNF
ncbi:WAP four-disulfide core domain protein 2 [Tenrec ecaudatus]|uniref:WAP four-disulfide core domain protein 2 n=1 Tax=Tenrec ecaudatus TaxID=94439 RepID=UPI003F59B1CD